MSEPYICLTGAPDPCEFENKEHHDATCEQCLSWTQNQETDLCK